MDESRRQNECMHKRRKIEEKEIKQRNNRQGRHGRRVVWNLREDFPDSDTERPNVTLFREDFVCETYD
jgi:hypothetical protein